MLNYNISIRTSVKIYKRCFLFCPQQSVKIRQEAGKWGQKHKRISVLVIPTLLYKLVEDFARVLGRRGHTNLFTLPQIRGAQYPCNLSQLGAASSSTQIRYHPPLGGIIDIVARLETFNLCTEEETTQLEDMGVWQQCGHF